MQVLTLRTVQYLWLVLLMVFVLCAAAVNPVCLAEVQQQGIELESEFVTDVPDDEPATGFMAGIYSSKVYPLSLCWNEILSVIDSDACASITLHGPPDSIGIV